MQACKPKLNGLIELVNGRFCYQCLNELSFSDVSHARENHP
ncbi:transposase [Serratia marcescens]|nr:transposase [Serratia marcescens]MBN5208093.1 transposase [Serratia marcescens]